MAKAVCIRAHTLAKRVDMIPQQNLQAPNIPKAKVLEFKTGGDPWRQRRTGCLKTNMCMYSTCMLPRRCIQMQSTWF